jgi:hypothetical protein
LQNPSQINGDNLKNVRREMGTNFSKTEEYLKEKIKQHGTNSKNKIIRDLCRGTDEFKN